MGIAVPACSRGPRPCVAVCAPPTRAAPVPVAPVVPPDPDDAALPPEVSRVTSPRPWKVIALHHSATERGGAAAFDKMHKARGWDGVGYHFVVGNGTDTADGALETTFRWREQREGAHVKGWNDIAIGICLVGNFEEADPTAAQLETLRRLVRHLRRRFAVPPERVVGHGRLGTTLCPGKRFPLDAVVAGSDPAGAKAP
jgi:N-acetyl-anhydromuramyl-L-alanine amidase AmpD